MSDLPGPANTGNSSSFPSEPPPGGDAMPSNEDRTMALLAHLLGILTWFIGALVIWLIRKDHSPFVDDQGREALNFQITISIGYLVVIVAACATFGLGAFIAPVVSILNIIFCIVGGVAAYNGERYRYPVCIRLV